MTFESILLSTPNVFNEFVRMLTTTGDVVVGPYDQNEIEFDSDFREILQQMDQARRVEMGEGTPQIDHGAAEWAAGQLYRACQFLVCRDVPESIVAQTLTRACPVARTPTVDYSVDLFFSFMPDLIEMANRLAPGDPLLANLLNWARDWPLSSVGVEVGKEVSSDSFASSPTLLRLYADRVAERRAKDRLNDLPLRAVLRADAGMFPDLLPFSASTYAHE